MMLYGFVSSVANAIFSGTMSELNNKSVVTYRSATVLKILKILVNIGKVLETINFQATFKN